MYVPARFAVTDAEIAAVLRTGGSAHLATPTASGLADRDGDVAEAMHTTR